MTYDQFDTIATQLGDGARVDAKIDGKWHTDWLLNWCPDDMKGHFWEIRKGPNFYEIVDVSVFRMWTPIISVDRIQELTIHSPEPMKEPNDEQVIYYDREEKIELLRLNKKTGTATINGVEYVKKEEQEEKKVQKRWRAEKGEKYSTLGVAFDLIDKVESGDMVDDKNWKYGLYWRTEKEAIDFADKQLAITRVNDYILEHFGEWEPDWKNSDQKKWCIYYDHYDKCFDYDSYVYYQEPSPIGYCRSGEQAKQVIRDCGDDLEVIWGVEK